MTFIAIEGVIGVGKTTLARYLREALNATLVLEVFEENPFLSSFYQDRDRYAFQTQIFFLLSRYQQLQELSKALPPIVSDYMFAKDALFANLNIKGDELEMYNRVHHALAGNIPQPDLVVYLRADTPILMNRIALRDRSYERNMDEGYIDGLRVAYEHFFTDYQASPLLVIDSGELDIIRNEEDRRYVIQRIRGALGEGPRQPALPGLGNVQTDTPIPTGEAAPSDLNNSTRRLMDFQHFHRYLDEEKGFNTDVLWNFIGLQEEVGELAKVIKNLWTPSQADNPATRRAIREELADVLAYILKIANYTGIDLEAAYLEKMATNQKRTWH